MHDLFEILRTKVSDWSSQGYPCEKYPAIAEILEWSIISETKFYQRNTRTVCLRKDAGLSFLS